MFTEYATNVGQLHTPAYSHNQGESHGYSQSGGPYAATWYVIQGRKLLHQNISVEPLYWAIGKVIKGILEFKSVYVILIILQTSMQSNQSFVVLQMLI